MKIVMMTNTYLPHVGGVARSVDSFATTFRDRGHRVLVIAPKFKDCPENEHDVLRVPAIQNFNGSDFSVRLPANPAIPQTVQEFEPDIIHSHHPFLMGDTALAMAALVECPVVFTHHTMYEQYTQYVPGDSPAMKQFAIRLATEYANLVDHVIAPSRSVADILRSRGVETPITAIPTGIDPGKFAGGDGGAFRKQHDISDADFVIGHVGRLAVEKNLPFLARAVCALLKKHEAARFIVVGSGECVKQIEQIAADRGVSDRVLLTGTLQGSALADAYHAMNVFAFVSKSETQGMVLAEAMTAGVPVVAIDAPGAREVVEDAKNGRLLMTESEADFTNALDDIMKRDDTAVQSMRDAALQTAESFSLDRTADALFDLYERCIADENLPALSRDVDPLERIFDLLENEWKLWSARAQAVVDVAKDRFY